MPLNKEKIKKILIIKPGAIGDVLLATPVIENLRYHFPDAVINFLTQNFCREVLVDNPFLDRVLTYDIGKGDSSYCLIKNVHNQKYDMIIDLFCNPRTAIIVFNSEAKYKVGYRFGWRTLAYNVKIKPRSSEVHNIEFNLDSIRALGLDVITNKPKFFINAVHEEFAEKFFSESSLYGKRVIGVNPSGTWPTKVWPAEKFIELGKRLGKDSRILIFWGYGKEKEEAMRIKDSIGESALVIPEVDLKYMGALLKRCELFVTNDTGPMHIAWSLGVKTAVIFGPTNSHLQGPVNENSIILRNESLTCLGCNLTQLSECRYDHACMNELSVDDVYSKVMEFMKIQSN